MKILFLIAALAVLTSPVAQANDLTASDKVLVQCRARISGTQQITKSEVIPLKIQPSVRTTEVFSGEGTLAGLTIRATYETHVLGKVQLGVSAIDADGTVLAGAMSFTTVPRGSQSSAPLSVAFQLAGENARLTVFQCQIKVR
ncbi:MAG TPA: hypothetical protein VFV50_12825 [Bdellovibrionales bacterium]|nr:hypothetical protein [Bdellovibrionales bacterium]